VARDTKKPLSEVNFRCKGCRRTWSAAPERVADDEEIAAHPWRYFATCQQCGEEVEQAYWERTLLRAWTGGNSGPKSPEGIAATAKNLIGHPTPEETARTRFNAMKTGLHAKVATYFPAKPDGYAFCAQCEVERGWCAAQPACVKQTEKFMLHQAAFEQRDPKRLMGLYSDMHAAVFAVVQQMLQTIVADGVRLIAPKYSIDKDGVLNIATYMDHDAMQVKTINEMTAHPLIARVGELISRLNLSLADMGMTVKIVEHEDADQGRLSEETVQREQRTEFQERQIKALENLAQLVQRAKAQNASDPILVEHQQQAGNQA
jgi:hypothetical protein